MNNNLYLDLHILQTVPPSCVNRDDTGSPKTAIYGGVNRARVSSQAWKRAIRLAFIDSLDHDKLGIRTKGIVQMVADEMEKLGAARDLELAADGLEMAFNSKFKRSEVKKKDDKNGRTAIKDLEKGTDALFFMSQSQAHAVAELVVAGCTDNSLYNKAIKDNPSIDMALFGRMVAADPSLNYDATAQVAHAISTHAVHNEYDYFTAVDDNSPEDNAGAGHLGTVEFNSSTLYRYATINIAELRKQIGEDTAEAIRAFIRAFAMAMPTGKQNTFANRTIPNCIYATLRHDQPVNMVSAFESAVKPENGYVAGSVKALVKYATEEVVQFVPAPQNAWVVGNALSQLGTPVSFDAMIEDIVAKISL